ncbi:hypothetical protein KKC1_02290 [Calderihabitans maritimus]|uniref:Uncharacterized protein n=1 Tax=Calderihabitans maritimus TaxID=1246530 RepID=A0A1Z5HNW0_9FIRM|nr:hypothetical protein KKC1_02290 [Calderihabitans maritimus]
MRLFYFFNTKTEGALTEKYSSKIEAKSRNLAKKHEYVS